MTRAQSSLAALALLLGCAGYKYVGPQDEEPGEPGPGEVGGGSAGKPAVSKAGGGAGGKPTMSGAGRDGSAGTPSTTDHGGDGSAGESDGAAGSGGEPGAEPPLCDEATATVLGSMSTNSTVLSNVCLKIAIPADQTWITKITLQPELGQYPLPFTWTNCGATGSGAFTANYGNQVIQPVNLQCPIMIKLGGNAAQQVNVQWWGG